jgi:hypothetical protein
VTVMPLCLFFSHLHAACRWRMPRLAACRCRSVSLTCRRGQASCMPLACGWLASRPALRPVHVPKYSIGLLLFWRDSWSRVFFSDPGRVLWSRWCSHGGFDSICRQQTWAAALTSCHRTRSAAFRELRWDSFFRAQRTAKRSIQRCYQLSQSVLGGVESPSWKKTWSNENLYLQNRRRIGPFTHNLYAAIMDATAISGLTSELLTYCWWRDQNAYINIYNCKLYIYIYIKPSTDA